MSQLIPLYVAGPFAPGVKSMGGTGFRTVGVCVKNTN